MKAGQRNLRAFVEFYLLGAKDHSVRPATLWQCKAIQNQKPIAVAFRFWQEFVGSNPNPIGGSAPPASAVSAFAGHATGGFVARPDFADFSSCSDFGTKTIGNTRFQKVRNSERRFCLLISVFVQNFGSMTIFLHAKCKILKEIEEYTVLLHDSLSRALEINHTE
jgi:hypothetical protein